MNIGIFEDAGWTQLLPLVWTRSAFELRCGRDRLLDKVRAATGPRVARFWLREAIRDLIAERVPTDLPRAGEDWCLLNARLLVSGALTLPPVGTVWRGNGSILALSVAADVVETLSADVFLSESRLSEFCDGFRSEPAPPTVRLLHYPWDLIYANGDEIRRQCRQGGMHEGTVYSGVHFLNHGEICVSPGARVKSGVVLDAESGPIHIDRDAVIQPNAVIEGPCYVGPRSVVRPGAVLREGTSIGPVCKVGGEIEGTIFQGFSNKQHDGFLGHSFVGEWANLGADTISSDLKNTYGTIRVSLNGVGVETGKHFLGAIIADHAKTGIGTILPTGCILGLAANVFCRAPIPKFVPSYAWLSDEGMTPCHLHKIVQIARAVMGRRERTLSDVEQRLLEVTALLAREVEAAGWK